MRIIKRRLIIFSHIFFLICMMMVAEDEKNVNLFTPGMPAMSLQWGSSFPFRKDLRNPMPSADLIAAADFGELRCDSGIKCEYEQFDFTNNVSYMPTFFNSFQAGGGFTWHYYRYIDCFTENDLIVDGRFRWIKGPVFSFENAIGMLFKFASIDAIKEYKSFIFNVSYHFSLLCNWRLTPRSDVWFAINLQDYFDYPLAISPFIKFGGAYEVSPGLWFGLDYTLKYIDMFFSAVYLNESVLHFTFKVML